MTADWGALQRAIDGDVVLPGSPEYESVRKPVMARFEHLRPAAVVRCVTPRTSPRRWPSRAGWACRRRSGAAGTRSRAGPRPTGSSWTSHRWARWRSRPRWRPSVLACGSASSTTLATHGLTIPAGCGPSVGIAGLTLGGGRGILGRKHGLTCDHLPGVPHPPRARGHGVSADLAAGRGCRGGPGLAGLAPDAPDELDATLRLTAAGDGERPPGVEVVGSWSTGWAPTRWKRPAGTCPTGRPSGTWRGSARSRSKSHVTRRIKPADH